MPDVSDGKTYPGSAAVTLGLLLTHTLDFYRIARGPFVVQYLEHVASCDYRCRCGIAAASSLYHFLGQLAGPRLNFFQLSQCFCSDIWQLYAIMRFGH